MRRAAAAGLAAAAAVAGAAGLAAAEPPAGAGDDVVPDPRARRAAAEANLEPRRLREGLAIGFALGPSMQVGFGLEASGTGPGVELRIGASATARLLWLVTLATSGTPEDQSPTRFNQQSVLTLGAQVYALETLWLRAGVGVAGLSLMKEGSTEAERHGGFGAQAGGGIDLARRGRFALSGEFVLVAAVYGDGFTAAAVSRLGFTWY